VLYHQWPCLRCRCTTCIKQTISSFFVNFKGNIWNSTCSPIHLCNKTIWCEALLRRLVLLTVQYRLSTLLTYYFLRLSYNADDWLERPFPEVTYCVSRRTVNCADLLSVTDLIRHTYISRAGLTGATLHGRQTPGMRSELGDDLPAVSSYRWRPGDDWSTDPHPGPLSPTPSPLIHLGKHYIMLFMVPIDAGYYTGPPRPFFTCCSLLESDPVQYL